MEPRVFFPSLLTPSSLLPLPLSSPFLLYTLLIDFLDSLDDDAANTLFDLWDRMPKRRKVDENNANSVVTKSFANYNPNTHTFTRTPAPPMNSFTNFNNGHTFTNPSTPQNNKATSPYASMHTTPSPTQRSPQSVHNSPHSQARTPSPARPSSTHSSPSGTVDYAGLFANAQFHQSQMHRQNHYNLPVHQPPLQISPQHHGLHSQYVRPANPPDLSQLVLPQHPHTYPKLAQPAYSPLLQAQRQQVAFAQFLQSQQPQQHTHVQNIPNGSLTNFYTPYDISNNNNNIKLPTAPNYIVTESITYQKYDPSKSIVPPPPPLSLDAITRNWAPQQAMPMPPTAVHNHQHSTTTTQNKTQAVRKPRQPRPKKAPLPLTDSPAPPTPPVSTTPPFQNSYTDSEIDSESEMAERSLDGDLWDLQKQINCANELIKIVGFVPVELLTVIEHKPDWLFDGKLPPSPPPHALLPFPLFISSLLIYLSADSENEYADTKANKPKEKVLYILFILSIVIHFCLYQRDDYWDTDDEEEWESKDAHCPPPHINVEEYNMRYVHV
jgi:hypothetical protein